MQKIVQPALFAMEFAAIARQKNAINLGLKNQIQIWRYLAYYHTPSKPSF